jgi:hypothetical protein
MFAHAMQFWDAIPQSYIDRLILSMSHRIEAVKVAKAGYINYGSNCPKNHTARKPLPCSVDLSLRWCRLEQYLSCIEVLKLASVREF